MKNEKNIHYAVFKEQTIFIFVVDHEWNFDEFCVL
jgi:hypothetical protein